MRIFYGWLLVQPHVDKVCMERILAYCAGTPFEDENYRRDILPQGWRSLEGMPSEGGMKNVLVLRAALLTDGPARADMNTTERRSQRPYRVSVGDTERLGYTISRRDVAHFIVQEALDDWEKWKGKCVSLYN
jgi:hypothetical protein